MPGSVFLSTQAPSQEIISPRVCTLTCAKPQTTSVGEGAEGWRGNAPLVASSSTCPSGPAVTGPSLQEEWLKIEVSSNQRDSDLNTLCVPCGPVSLWEVPGSDLELLVAMVSEAASGGGGGGLPSVFAFSYRKSLEITRLWRGDGQCRREASGPQRRTRES